VAPVIGCRISCPSARQGASQSGRSGPEAKASAGASWSGTRRHSSREGVLVLTKPSLLTRRWWKWDLAACRGASLKGRARRDGCDRGRQRLCTRARCAEDNAATGRLSAEELRPMLHQDRAGSSLGPASGLRSRMPASGSRCYAEAGASPSSEASSEELLEAIGRRRLSTKRGAARPVGRCTWKSDSPEVLVSRVGCRSW